MEIVIFLCIIIFSHVSLSHGRYLREDIQKLLKSLKRRTILSSDEDILGVPESPEDLPEAEPIHPGHTLLQPSLGMLKSSAKYPRRDIDAPVYGNLDNLGITYGKTNQRILYTNFRKSNDLLIKFLTKAIQNIQVENRFKRNNSVIIIEIDPEDLMKQKGRTFNNRPPVVENNASEILDESADFDDLRGKEPEDSTTPKDASVSEQNIETRRRRQRKKSKFRDRHTSIDDSSSDSSSSSKSSDYEKNPGNPYTLHKNRYKQNWMWNHVMDGDHMNINPYAPGLSQVGPSGASLFFGRKWWYFNQDDFKPLN